MNTTILSRCRRYLISGGAVGFIIVYLMGSAHFSTVEAQKLTLFNDFGARAAGLGQSNIVSMQEPMVAFVNPAALSLMQDARFRMSADASFGYNHIAASQFFPRFGTFAFAVSRQSVAIPDSLILLNRNYLMERSGIGFGRILTPYLYFGAGFQFNNILRRKDQFASFSFSLMILPGQFNKTTPILSYSTNSPFNGIVLPDKYAFGVAVRDVPLNSRILEPTVDFGAFYRIHNKGSTLHGAISFSKSTSRQEARFGLAVPVSKGTHFVSGIRDFNINAYSVGVGLLFSSFSLDFAYTNSKRAISVDFAVRLGKNPEDRAGKHRAMSVEFAKEGEYKNATRELKKYMHYYPDDTLAVTLGQWLLKKQQEKENKINELFELAKLKQGEKQYLAAALHYRDILELDRRNKVATNELKKLRPLNDLRIVRLVEGAIRSYNQNELENAERVFRIILKLRADNELAMSYIKKIENYYLSESKDLFYQGLGFYNQKKYAQSLQALGKVIAYNPDNAEAQKYFKLAKKKQSEQESQVRSLITRAQAYDKKGQYVEACITFEQVLEINPNMPEVRFLLRKLRPKRDRQIESKIISGKNAFEDNKFDKARSIFSSLLTFNAAKRTAKTYLDRIEKRQENEIRRLYRNADEHFAKKEWDGAIVAFDSVLAMDDDYRDAVAKRQQAIVESNFESLLRLAEQRFSEKEYLKAIELFRRIEKRVPGNAMVTRRIKECQSYLSDLIEQRFSQGVALYAAENYKGAIVELEYVLKLFPDHPESEKYLKKAKQRLAALEALQYQEY